MNYTDVLHIQSIRQCDFFAVYHAYHIHFFLNIFYIYIYIYMCMCVCIWATFKNTVNSQR